MEAESEVWNLNDWKKYALAVREAHQSALDGWCATVSELEAHSRLIAKLSESNAALHQQIALLQTAVMESTAQQKPKRGKGRPKKQGDFNFAAWYEVECLPKYKAKNRGSLPGMQKVLTWHFQQMLKELGRNTLKVNSSAYQAKLKTIVNQISDQRHPVRGSRPS